MAPPGYTFLELDYRALEAVLVGYFANSLRYTRFAKLGVHAYLAAHLPEVGWEIDLALPDSEIKKIFSQLKKEHDGPYNVAKRTVHLSNYLGTPRRMWDEYPETFPSIKEAAALQQFYFDLFPEIPEWHRRLTQQVDGARRRKMEEGEEVDPWTLGVASIQNPFGYMHRFYHVLEWKKVEGEWYSSFGEDAKRLIAFLPQSTGAGIIKKATRELWHEYPEIGRMLRLLVHDSIIAEVPEKEAEEIARIIAAVMTRPVEQLPLDPAWGLGDYLSIDVEAKMGKVWSQMEVIE